MQLLHVLNAEQVTQFVKLHVNNVQSVPKYPVLHNLQTSGVKHPTLQLGIAQLTIEQSIPMNPVIH